MMKMSPQAAVRAQARDALRHRYAPAILGFTVLVLLYTVADGVSACFMFLFMSFISDEAVITALSVVVVWPVMIVISVLLSPLINGYIRMFYRNALTDRMDPADLYYYMTRGRYARTLRLNLSFLLRMLLPAVLFFLPVTIYEFICQSYAADFCGSVLYVDFFFILCVLSVILVTLYSLKYFLVFSLYTENESLSNNSLFTMSRLIMRAHGTSAAKLIFSYTPWMLLCLTVLPMFYIVPYMTQGLCIGAKWMSRTFDNWTDVQPGLREVMYESITMHDRV